MAAGVEVEGAGFAHQCHARCGGGLISLLAVARVAASHEVLPRGQTSAGTGNHVVECEFSGSQDQRAVLAGIAVAEQNVFARERARLMRDTAVLEQADHGRHTHCNPGGVQEVAILFLRHGDAFQHKHNRAPGGAHVDGLIGGVEYQYRGMQSLRIRIGSGGHSKHPRRGPAHHAPHRIVDLCSHKPTQPCAAMVSSLSLSWGWKWTACTSALRVRATVATHTRVAPARRNTRAHSEAVAPVVKASSTKSTSLPDTGSLS